MSIDRCFAATQLEFQFMRDLRLRLWNEAQIKNMMQLYRIPKEQANQYLLQYVTDGHALHFRKKNHHKYFYDAGPEQYTV